VVAHGLRPAYPALAGIALVTAGAFGTSLLLWESAPTALHEVAGGILLALLVAATAIGWGARRESPGAVRRAGLALAILVAMGGSGAALAIGALPPEDAFVPGVILLFLIMALGEMVRYSVRWERPSNGVPEAARGNAGPKSD